MSLFEYRFDDLLNPVLQAFHLVDGSATRDEIIREVTRTLNLDPDVVDAPYSPSVSQMEYTVRRTLCCLNKYGLIERSPRKVWALTARGSKTTVVNKKTVCAELAEVFAAEAAALGRPLADPTDTDYWCQFSEDIQPLGWQEVLLNVLREMPAAAFWRLGHRMLRENGFENIETSGKPEEGVLQGTALYHHNHSISFLVTLQYRRDSGPVPGSVVRDFRGTVSGRTERGLIMTTGYFSHEAKEEARRPGAAPVELIPGLYFAERLKELGLGVREEPAPRVRIDRDWFMSC